MFHPSPDFPKLHGGLLRAAHMNQAQSYLERGRYLKNHSDSELLETWVEAFERWFGSRSCQTGRKMDDVATEIRLRGLAIPYDRVRPQIDHLKKRVQAYDPESLRSKIQRFGEHRGASTKRQN
jgi:hypothetical protein